jgi:hypothetical protein
MHHSRLCALLIDCRTADIDQATKFWAEALGRAMDPDHPGTRGNYRMLETPRGDASPNGAAVLCRASAASGLSQERHALVLRLAANGSGT